jgi:hypothetical protein
MVAGPRATGGLEKRCRPRAGLSIVIPVTSRLGRDAIKAFEETLVSVLENRPDDTEVIVVLGCEYSDPWSIRDEVEFLRAPEGSSLVACVNVGLGGCSGEIIHVLAPGWRATPDWADAALAQFESPKVGAVVPVIVSEKKRDHTLSQGIAYRSGGQRVVVKPPRARAGEAVFRPAWGPPLQAGFWRADVLELDGHGFAATCGDSHADCDLAVAARIAGYETVVEPKSSVVESSRKVPAVSGFRAGLHAERLFWRSAAGRPTVMPLVSHLFEILRHAVARAPFGTLPMPAGRALALIQFGSYLGRYRRLKAIAASAAADSGERILRLDGGNQLLRGPSPKRREPLRRSA